MTKKAIIIASIVLAVVAAPSFAVPTTLQNDLNGYDGQRNQGLAGGGWGANSYSVTGGDAPFIMENATYSNVGDGFVVRTLMRFQDIASMLPAGHTVVNSAVLEMDYVAQNGAEGTVVARQALQPWTHGNTYWLNWGNGGDDAGYMGAIVGSFDPTVAPTSFSLDTAMVESWISSPGTNHGVVLLYDTGLVGPEWPHLEWGGENEPSGWNPDVSASPFAPRLILDTIPEPATMALLGLGGLMVLRRRRSA